MEQGFSSQENVRIRQKLVLENIRRVLFASFISLFVIPMLMISNKLFSASELAATYNVVLIVFECFSAMSLVTAYTLIKMKDSNLGKFVYRTYWLMFEMFSLTVIYADTIMGSKLSFYAVMLVTITLVPVMTMSEQLYYMLIQAVYAIFMAVKFGFTASDAINIFLMNGIALALSRSVFNQILEKMTLKERAREAKDSVHIDQVTRLLNRRGLEKRVDDDLMTCIRSKKRMSLLMIDIDDMQAYNDGFGGDRGDECIKSIAETLKQVSLRNTDVLCRLVGGRFLVYMQGGTDMEPVRLAEKIRRMVEDKRIPQGRRATYKYVTVSIGVASCIPRSEENFPELYDEAEEAMLSAKEQGKNVIVYEEQVYGACNRRAN